MTSVPITEALGNTFITAILLTGSAEGAEAAILEGIKVMGRGDIPADALLQGTMEASIAATIRGQVVEEQEYTSSLLPIELRRLLRLSQPLRRCFVLRVLVGLSREICARMLQTEPHRIDELLCLAARALACLPEEGAAQWECAGVDSVPVWELHSCLLCSDSVM